MCVVLTGGRRTTRLGLKESLSPQLTSSDEPHCRPVATGDLLLGVLAILAVAFPSVFVIVVIVIIKDGRIPPALCITVILTFSRENLREVKGKGKI